MINVDNSRKYALANANVRTLKRIWMDNREFMPTANIGVWAHENINAQASATSRNNYTFSAKSSNTMLLVINGNSISEARLDYSEDFAGFAYSFRNVADIRELKWGRYCIGDSTTRYLNSASISPLPYFSINVGNILNLTGGSEVSVEMIVLWKSLDSASVVKYSIMHPFFRSRSSSSSSWEKAVAQVDDMSVLSSYGSENIYGCTIRKTFTSGVHFVEHPVIPVLNKTNNISPVGTTRIWSQYIGIGAY